MGAEEKKKKRATEEEEKDPPMSTFNPKNEICADSELHRPR